VYLVTGLGNPGRSYAKTRHNAGFMLVDRMAEEAGQVFEPAGKHSLTCTVQRNQEDIVLAKPQTYMNLSGNSVRELLESYPVTLPKVLIVFDDLALPFGTIRIRRSGGSSGNQGMESVIEALGTNQIPRLRIGIGSDSPPRDCSDFVLAPFSRAELKALDEILDHSVRAVDSILSAGIEQTMGLYN